MAEVATIVTASAAGLTVLSKAKPEFWDPLVKRILSSKDEKIVSDALGEAIEVLVCQMKDYDHTVRNHWSKVPSKTYQHWVQRVEKIEDEAKLLLAKPERKNKIRYFASPLRHTSIKEMQKLGEQVAELKEAGDNLGDKLFAGPKVEVVVRNTETPEIRKFHTLQDPLEQILILLKNDKVYTVGIYGPLGIGKTTIIWNLNNHEEVFVLFDVVIWVKASTENSKENISVEHLQHTIFRRLKLDMEGNNDAEEVRRAISAALRGRKYLLLFDDVKESLNLEQIGIPENKNGSKVVLTSRLHHVCSTTVDRVIKVNYLSLDEAWKMFQDIMNQPKLIKDPKIGPLAWRVCKECCGLPLLVEKVASTFRLKNNEYHWLDGLNSWRMWPEKECQGIKEIYNLLKFCYDDLDDDHQRRCFLYGALYPEDSDICSDYLLECWAAEDLLSKGSDRIDMRLMYAHLVLSRLKIVSLLEEGKSENYVTMNKLMRQVALYILEDYSEFKHLVLTNGALREPPDVKLWREKNRISLSENELSKLPDSPNCRELYTLFLQQNLNLEEIPSPFFEDMENLRVLDLSHTGIMSLPSSLLLLIKLKILYLNNCRQLKTLPADITKLEHLEVLDIRGSGIFNIPGYIEKMINLRRLRVSFSESASADATQEEKFDHNIISNLSRLEELAIDVKTPDQWSNKLVGDLMNAVATLKNFKILKFFFSDKVVDAIDVAPTTLRVSVPEGTILLSFIAKSRWGSVKNIKSFQFFIGSRSSERPKLPNFVRYNKYIKYCNGEGKIFPIEPLSVADAFELVNHKDIKQLSEIGIANMNNVQGCLVENCDAFETVLNATDEVVLPNLEHLYLRNLQKFRSICEGSIRRGSLTKVKTLVFISCHLLTEIFTASVIEQLCEIEHLTVQDCPQVEKLFTTVASPHVLPNLRKLKLLGLPKLTNVCETNALNWPSLEKLLISDCPQLRELPINEVNATELRVIKASQEWWDSTYWQNEKTKEHLQKFCVLRQ